MVSPLFTEFDGLQEDFAQAHMETGVHYIDRTEAAREAMGRGKNLDLVGGKVSETLAGSYLAPRKASDLLIDSPDFSEIPTSLDKEIVLRYKAHEAATKIDQVLDVNLIPVLSRFLAGVDLDSLNNPDLVSDAITEKVAIVSLHKIIELVGKNGGTVEYELPKQVTNYIETIRRIKSVMYELEALAEQHTILERPMQEVVHSDDKWLGQEEMDDAVKTEEKNYLGSQIFRNIAGNDNYLRRAIQYSQLWENEGLSTDGIYHLSGEQVVRFLQLSTRYFCWYTLLDEQFKNEAEDNYLDDFEAFSATFTDNKDPNYIGHMVPQELHESIIKELEVANDALFKEE